MMNYEPPTSHTIGHVSALAYRLARIGGIHQLSDADSKILQAIRDNLPVKAAQVLSAQLDFCDFFPHSFGRQTTEFLKLQGRVVMVPTPELCFVSTLKGIPLASLTVVRKHGEIERSARVDLYLWQGRLYHMSCERRPKAAFHATSLSANECLIRDVNVLFDPMREDAFVALETEDRTRLPAWLRSMLQSDGSTTMLAPLNAHERTRIVNHYGLEFPDDYLELVESIEYLRCADDFEIFGPSRIWSFVTPHEYLVVLADSGHGYICLRRDAAPGLYFYGHSDLMPVPLSNSFRRALERAVVEEIQD